MTSSQPIRTAYIAHPLGQGEDREKNRSNAAIWGCWVAERFNRAVSADWIWLSSVWSEEKRELGLMIDKVYVRRCDEIWLCGPRISPGMSIELHEHLTGGFPNGHPRCVIDLTSLKLELPDLRAEACARTTLEALEIL